MCAVTETPQYVQSIPVAVMLVPYKEPSITDQTMVQRPLSSLIEVNVLTTATGASNVTGPVSSLLKKC